MSRDDGRFLLNALPKPNINPSGIFAFTLKARKQLKYYTLCTNTRQLNAKETNGIMELYRDLKNKSGIIYQQYTHVVPNNMTEILKGTCYKTSY